MTPNRHRHIRKLKMRRLLDRWHIGAIILICVIKFLQLIKKLGFRVEESGWRKFAGVYLRKEHSKFILASFRLTCFDKNDMPKDLNVAKDIFIKKLALFLRKNTVCHWCFEYGVFRDRRKKLFFTDITEAVFNENGVLVRILPYFDDTRITFTKISDIVKDKALRKIVFIFNKNEASGIGDIKRAKVISRKLKRWAFKTSGLSYSGRRELVHFIDRILCSTFIQFDLMPDDKTELSHVRFSTPDMRSRRHPGFGLLNIVCRLFSDFEEADLWVQYHHVPVDGMPMEEKLEQLKNEWGTAGKIKFPALKDIKPEVRYFGDRIFRGRIFVSFEKLLKLRKYLNKKYYDKMGGGATVSGMIIWGLAQRQYFRETKYVITTDTEVKSDLLEDRNIGLVFIRPGDFIDENSELNGFLKFQREFNHRIYSTKYGRSESSELLEIYAMIHPIVLLSLKLFLPKAMKELVGTAGLTILKQVEVFVSPLTDLQINGFVAFGNMKVETEDGSTAGAVSFCARKEQVREYIKGFTELTNNYHEFLGINESNIL
jgi:hypothetical protein